MLQYFSDFLSSVPSVVQTFSKWRKPLFIENRLDNKTYLGFEFSRMSPIADRNLAESGARIACRSGTTLTTI